MDAHRQIDVVMSSVPRFRPETSVLLVVRRHLMRKAYCELRLVQNAHCFPCLILLHLVSVSTWASLGSRKQKPVDFTIEKGNARKNNRRSVINKNKKHPSRTVISCGAILCQIAGILTQDLDIPRNPYSSATAASCSPAASKAMLTNATIAYRASFPPLCKLRVQIFNPVIILDKEGELASFRDPW